MKISSATVSLVFVLAFAPTLPASAADVIRFQARPRTRQTTQQRETLHPRQVLFERALHVNEQHEWHKLLGDGAQVNFGPGLTMVIKHPGKNEHLRRLMANHNADTLMIGQFARDPNTSFHFVCSSIGQPTLEKEQFAAAVCGHTAPAAFNLASVNTSEPLNRTHFCKRTGADGRSLLANMASYQEFLTIAHHLVTQSDRTDPLLELVAERLAATLDANRTKTGRIFLKISTITKELDYSTKVAQRQLTKWKSYSKRLAAGKYVADHHKVHGAFRNDWAAELLPGGLVQITVGQTAFDFAPDELPGTMTPVGLSSAGRNFSHGANLAEYGYCTPVLKRIHALRDGLTATKRQLKAMNSEAAKLVKALERQLSGKKIR